MISTYRAVAASASDAVNYSSGGSGHGISRRVLRFSPECFPPQASIFLEVNLQVRTGPLYVAFPSRLDGARAIAHRHTSWVQLVIRVETGQGGCLRIVPV